MYSTLCGGGAPCGVLSERGPEHIKILQGGECTVQSSPGISLATQQQQQHGFPQLQHAWPHTATDLDSVLNILQ